jgi:hypothetical protein
MKAKSTHVVALCCLLFCIATRVFAQSYTFTTLAGAASQGSIDGSVTNARFFAPQGITVNVQGTVYIADSDNSTIRQVTTNGQVSTIAGRAGVTGFANGTGSNTLFYLPKSLAADANGNLYVADTFNQLVRKLTPTDSNWAVSTLAGRVGVASYADGTGTNALFKLPASVTVDAAGNVYVADQGNNVIRKITPSGIVTTIAGRVGSSASIDGTNNSAQFASPIGIAAGSNTNLYVTDSDNTIRMMMPIGTNWIVTTIAGQTNNYGSADGLGTNALFWGPAGVTMDTNGNLYIADSFNKTIRKLIPDGTNWQVSTLAGLAGAQGSTDGTNSDARFGSPLGVATDTNGDVFVADVNNNNIRKITPVGTNGVVTTFAGTGPGSTDGPGANARFWITAAVTVDASNNVFVADFFNNTIRKIATNGLVSTLAGLAGSTGSSDGTNSDARFNGPEDVAVDRGGNVYIADIFNNCIRKITPAGTNWVVTTIAGRADTPPGEADGIGTNALLYNPTGIAVDMQTNLYVTDNSGQTIRKIIPTGTNWMVTTIAGFPFTMGSADGTGTNALFVYPHGIAVDGGTNVYVADTENDTIRKLSFDGTNWIVTTIAGQVGVNGSSDGTGTNALFFFPEGITLNKAGNLFVADTFNETLRKLTLVGTNWNSTTIAGQVQISGNTDGFGTNALFNLPGGIEAGNTGLYVADTYNNTVRLGQIIAPPPLQIAFSHGLIVLFWPNTGSFSLQTNDDLLSASAWGLYSGAVITINATNSVTIVPPTSHLFFRLAGQ